MSAETELRLGRTGVARLGAGTDQPVRNDLRRRVALSGDVLPSLAQVVRTSKSAAGVPLSTSRAGSLFEDGGGSGGRWYLPGFTPAPHPDVTFAFAAVQAGSDAGGAPFNQATLTVGLRKVVPADAAAALAAPGARVAEIPLAGLAAQLVLASIAEDGTARQTRVPAQVAVDGDRVTVTVPGLLGRDVPLAYTALTGTGAAAVELSWSYPTVRWLTRWTPGGHTSPGPRAPIPQEESFAARRPDVAVLDREAPAARIAAPAARIAAGGKTVTYALHELAVETVTVPLGTGYAGPSYRPAFTLTADGRTRGIVDLDDLRTFTSTRSEYVELTVLGNVAARYPSLRAVYLGQVSGTVVAVPAAYGIRLGTGGCAAALDAVLDPSPQSASGCRFQLAFHLGPLVDPGDLARLAADLETEPTLDDRDLRVTLPADLDRDTPSTLQSGAVSQVSFGVGLVPGTFRAAFDLTDDAVPAVVKANLLLSQLHSATVQSVTGRLALRLDDAYADDVAADVVLNLRATAGSDDLVVQLDQTGAAVTNATAFELALTRVTLHGPDGYTTRADGTRVPPGGSVALPVPAGTDEVLVDRTLALPADVPDLDRYVAFTVADVQSVKHVLGLNAAGQLAGLGITAVSATLALTGAPGVALPVLTLTPQHEVEQIGVQVPVASVLRGLTGTVALTVTGAPGSPPWHRQLEHDFLGTPLLTLTGAELGRPSGPAGG